jgi:RND superfamily putative drug exporter
MRAVSGFVLGHKRVVAVFWLVVLVAGGMASARLASRLSAQFPLPGTVSYQANQQILRLYGNGGSGYPEVAVVRLPPGQPAAGPAGRQALARAFAAVAAMPGLRVAAYPGTGDRAFLGGDGRTSYGLVFTPFAGELQPPSLAPQITAAMAPRLPAGSTVQVTGMNELASGGQARQGFGVLAETLLAGVAALAVLAFVFGSALALIPLLMAAVAIPACFLAVFGLTEITSVSVIVQYLVALIGLGVAIDYSLLVTRWREELAAGHASQDAVTRAMATAGRSIVFSGGTVAIGLLSLILLPVPALRSIGIGGMLVPAVSVAVTVTLLPVLLATAGPRMDWPRRRRPAAGSRGWAAWARLVIRNKWAATAAALAVLGLLGAAAAGITVGEPAAAALGTTTPAAQALRGLAQAGVPAGVLDPIEIITPARAHPAQLARRLAALPGVRAAVAPAGPAWQHGGTALISVQPVGEPSTTAGAAVLARVRDTAASVPGTLTGGPGALLLDEDHAFYGRFPLLIAVLAAVTIVLLARAFGSLLLPVKAVILNLVSVGATYGVIVLIWQHGHGSRAIWGIPATGPSPTGCR